jgi:acetyl esterase/lipase
MRWVRSHAESLGIDPSHICAEGGSSGAQLALLLGVVPTIDPGDTSGLLPGVSPQANCAISVSGIGDEMAYAQTIGVVPRVLIGPAGVPPARIPAIEASASPALRVHRGAPPALIVHGLQDDKVLFAQAVSMQAALVRAGTPAWLVSYRGGHMLTGLDAAQSSGVWALVQSFALAERLPGPPREMSLAGALEQLQ